MRPVFLSEQTFDQQKSLSINRSKEIQIYKLLCLLRVCCFITVDLLNPPKQKKSNNGFNTNPRLGFNCPWFSTAFNGKGRRFFRRGFPQKDQRYWAARLFELGCGSQVGKPRMKNFQPNPSIFFVMIKLGEGVGVGFFVDIDAVQDLYYSTYIFILLHLHIHNIIFHWPVYIMHIAYLLVP